jgi:hypothetical protein
MINQILKIFRKFQQPAQPTATSSIFDKPMSFRTVHPDERLSFDKWSKKFKVGKSFTLLEDSEWLQKVRRHNNIKSIDPEAPVYLIKGLFD